MPFPSMKVVPDGWSEHHAEAAEGWFTGWCEIRHPGGKTGYPDYAPSPGALIWQGPCSAQAISRPADMPVVGETVPLDTYLVSISLKAPLLPAGEESAEIWPKLNPDDPQLVGRMLKLVKAQTGTTNWTRDLICEDYGRP